MMPPSFRLILATCLACLLLFAARAAAADPPARPIVSVAVAAGDPDLDPASLRAAIGVELGQDAVAPDDPRAATAAGVVTVSIDRGAHALVVAYRGANEPLRRAIDLPADRASIQRAVVLLAGNLARDEASDLAASLRKPAPPAPPPAAPSSAEAATDDVRELDRLGAALAHEQHEAGERSTAGWILMAGGFTTLGLSAGGAIYSLSSHRTLWSSDSGFMMLAASDLFFMTGGSLRAGADQLDELEDSYRVARDSLSPDGARADVLARWRNMARREGRVRLGVGWVLTGIGVGGLALSGALLTYDAQNKQSVAMPITFGADFVAAIALGLLDVTTDGPIARSLHAYERESGAASPAGASAWMAPFVAPASGGGVAGIGGRF